MLTVLSWKEPQKKTLWKKIKQKLFGIHAEITEKEIERVLIRTIFCEREHFTRLMREIAALAGGESGDMLLPADFTAPDGCLISAYEPTDFVSAVQKTALRYILKKAKINPQELTVSLIDNKSRHSGLLAELLCYAAEVRAVCESGLYDDAAGRAMELTGASVITGEQPGNDRMIVSFEPGDTYILLNGRDRIDGYFVRPPYEFAREFGSRYDEWLLCSMLYEKCGVRVLENTLPESVMLNGRRLPLNEIPGLFRTRT